MFCKALFVVVLLSSSAARAEWHQASSEHFVVYSDDAPERVKAFATRMERFDKAIKVLRVVPEIKRGPAARVTIYVVSSLSDIQRLARQRNVAGFYSARASGPVAFVPRQTGGGGSSDISGQRVVLHEYGHHFMFADWPSAIFPKWFVEGFAEFHSTAIFGDDGSITFGAPPADRGRGVTMVNEMPLKRMLRTDPGRLSDVETYALYSRGWLMTHYLTFEPDRRRQLGEYVGAINAGKPAAEASKVFGDLNSLDFKLTSYVKRPRFQSATIRPDQISIGDIRVRKLGAGEAATMPARIRSNAGVTEADAPKVAALARQLAARFPNDAAAQNELAEAEYDAKNYAAAEAAADRAMAADPKSVHAALYKGMALQAVAEKTGAADTAKWQAVRRWYAAANRIDPEDPQPLVMFYRSFTAAKQTPPQSAEKGLTYAFALAPYDLPLRLDAATVFLRQNKPAEARQALLILSANDESGAYGSTVREVLATLDKDGPAAALSSLIKAMDKAKAEAESAKKG